MRNALIRNDSLRATSAIAGLLLLTAACQPAPATPAATVAPAKPTAAPTAAAAQPTEAAASKPTGEPRRGGILKIVTANDPASFDLHQEASILALQAIAPAYNTLVTIDPDTGKIVGDLAESFEVSSDGRVFTFRFHPNIKWHDGTPFTAEDARYSFERMRKPPQGVRSPRAPNLDFIQSLEAVDGRTFRITLAVPNVAFLENLTASWFVVMPKHMLAAGRDMKKEVVGTGPFKYKAYTPGVSIELVRNPEYFKAGLPYLDGLTVLIVKDALTRLATMRTGQAHLTGRIFANLQPSDVETLKGSPVTVVRSPGLGGGRLQMNVTRKPFDDVRVRQALSISFDRDGAIQSVGDGVGTLGTFLAPGPWGLTETELRQLRGFRQPKSVDIAQAKELLAEAGLAQGFRTSILTRIQESRLAQYWQAQLKQISVDASIDLQEQAVLAERQANANFDLLATSAYMFTNDPSGLDRIWGTGAPQNYGKYGNPKVDDLLRQVASAQDPKRRLELTHEVDRLLQQDAPTIQPFYEEALVGINNSVRGYPTPPSQFTLMSYETVWLAN